MNKNLVFLLLSILLAACTSVTESQMQTVIAESVAAREAEVVEATEAADRQEAESIFQALTEQAETLEDLQATVDSVPTLTTTPDYTPTVSPTPKPKGSVIASNQRIVEAKDNTPWYYLKGYNQGGVPIILKTNPVQRFEDGTQFRVYKKTILGDGGLVFYKISSPGFEGYYVLKDDARKVTP